MWKWECPKQPKVVFEHHSWTSLNESLTFHEDGVDIPGLITLPPCDEEHVYWDDGTPCSTPRCTHRYIRDDEQPVD
jgi:hypothetical protein